MRNFDALSTLKVNELQTEKTKTSKPTTRQFHRFNQRNIKFQVPFSQQYVLTAITNHYWHLIIVLIAN